MPRRSGREAGEYSENAKKARWRYIIRNPVFLNDLKEVSSLYAGQAPPWSARYDEFRRKWRLQFIGLEILSGLPHLGSDISLIEFLEAYEGAVLSFPVVAHEGDNDEPWVTFTVDPSYPLDVLVAAFEEEAKEIIERQQGRKRLDKTDFYLRVYDLAAAGKTYAEIAGVLSQPISTVKSAYVAARRNIFGGAGGPVKRTVGLENFDFEAHMNRCAICKAAETADAFCSEALRYFNQDQRVQRELTGLDTVHDRIAAPEPDPDPETE